MSVRGVFFDLGGTLFSYSGIRRATTPLLMEAIRRMGISGEPPEISRAYQRASREVSEEYAAKSFYLHRDLFRDTFVRFTEYVNGNFDEQDYTWYRSEQHNLVLSNLILKNDCRSTLQHLKEQGLYLSIVSNIDEDMLHPLVAREGLHEYLHDWTSSEAAGSCKPHLKFFEVSIEKSGLAAENVLFVGDSPEHDIQGAHAAGMQTVLIVEQGVEPPLQVGRETVAPNHTISTLSELKLLV